MGGGFSPLSLPLRRSHFRSWKRGGGIREVSKLSTVVAVHRQPPTDKEEKGEERKQSGIQKKRRCLERRGGGEKEKIRWANKAMVERPFPPPPSSLPTITLASASTSELGRRKVGGKSNSPALPSATQVQRRGGCHSQKVCQRRRRRRRGRRRRRRGGGGLAV